MTLLAYLQFQSKDIKLKTHLMLQGTDHQY